MQSEHQKYTLVEALNPKGAEAWNAPSTERKWQNANVLAVLCSDRDEPLPWQLRERQRSTHLDLDTNVVSEAKRQGRDVLLACLEHKDVSVAFCTGTRVLPPFGTPWRQALLATLKQKSKNPPAECTQ